MHNRNPHIGLLLVHFKKLNGLEVLNCTIPIGEQFEVTGGLMGTFVNTLTPLPPTLKHDGPKIVCTPKVSYHCSQYYK